MFKDFIDRVKDGAPWGSTGLNTDGWMANIKTKKVLISDLVATQPGVMLYALTENYHSPYSRDRYPHVVKYDNVMYLEDGHHRVVKALLAGKKRVVVRLLDLDMPNVL